MSFQPARYPRVAREPALLAFHRCLEHQREYGDDGQWQGKSEDGTDQRDMTEDVNQRENGTHPDLKNQRFQAHGAEKNVMTALELPKDQGWQSAENPEMWGHQ